MDGVSEKHRFVSNGNRAEYKKDCAWWEGGNLCKRFTAGWLEPRTSSPEKTHSIVSRNSESGATVTPFSS